MAGEFSVKRWVMCRGEVAPKGVKKKMKVSLIIAVIILIISSLGLISTVLLQSGRSAGLSGAIAGAGEQFFGKKKGLDEFFGKLSVIFAIVFLLAAMAVVLLQ